MYKHILHVPLCILYMYRIYSMSDTQGTPKRSLSNEIKRKILTHLEKHAAENTYLSRRRSKPFSYN